MRTQFRSAAAVAISLLLFSVAACAQAVDIPAIQVSLSSVTQSRLKTYESDAARGDYQAMRNYAYTWSTDAAKEQPAASVVGCAWYAMVLKVHPQRVHMGDQSNKDLYCGRLSMDQARQAGAIVSRLEPGLVERQAAK